MEQTTLLARPREQTGKCPNRRLRKDGRVPAVLYGKGIKDSIVLSLNAKELEKVLHTAAGGNVIVNLNLEGDKALKKAMFKSISHHPLTGAIEHIDLIEVRMDHNITITVPVHIVGKAAGAALGGIVQPGARGIRIECLPGQIPDAVDADVTPLGIGQALHVRDLSLPEGVKILDDLNMTIASVVAPTIEVAPKTAEEVEAELAKSFEEKEEPKEEKEEEK